jgi:hypothetical protein|tara:strand:- start:749 stop:1156 length:408 start_codon:yes stop_codon:yes gene_type:complete
MIILKTNDIPPKEFAKLFKKLMDKGGVQVCFPPVEEDLDNITNKGLFFNTRRIRMNKGAPCQCHRNSAYCWEANKSLLDICTGYALSEDGIWRQHSWCMLKETKQVVETTIKRIEYFGFVLSSDEAQTFYELNDY